MSRLHDNYTKKVLPALRKEFGIANIMAVPRVTKIAVNVGVGRMAKDAGAIERVERDLAALTGQKPSRRLAKQSIASFKLRQGTPVGVAVTLRGRRMWDFLERLITIALPLSKDFRGIDPKHFDREGNLNIGIKEHSIFPEVNVENVRDIFSMQVTITTSAKNREQGVALLTMLGFPLKK
ncbi:MAG: 50S ribosomal protein L5 [Candidatus Yanofskybacteria bacterium]|nr:50S ribosomal protein L5 [Candidatus Yanofskybacteria bacterium]